MKVERLTLEEIEARKKAADCLRSNGFPEIAAELEHEWELVGYVSMRKTPGHPNFSPGDISWMDVRSVTDGPMKEDKDWLDIAIYTPVKL